MPSPREFYEKGLGDRFLEAVHYSTEISSFLHSEENLVNSLSPAFDLLIEVGCMHGRYLNWAVSQSKNYLGIDIVSKYVEGGRRRTSERGLCQKSYRFILGSAEEMGKLIDPDELHVSIDRCLLLFPFNSFGNIPDTASVIRNLSACGLPFLISSYLVSDLATQCRTEYYRRCGYAGIQISREEYGVCLSASGGLRSIAFFPEYLKALFKGEELAVAMVPLSRIGVAYGSEDIVSRSALTHALEMPSVRALDSTISWGNEGSRPPAANHEDPFSGNGEDDA